MIINLFIISISVAGFAILWRNLIYDSPNLRANLKKVPNFLHIALTCGFCFTFWISLVAAILFDPFQAWQVPFRIVALAPLSPLFEYIASWMAVGTFAAMIRFAYIAIQEFVHYEVHHLNHREH